MSHEGFEAVHDGFRGGFMHFSWYRCFLNLLHHRFHRRWQDGERVRVEANAKMQKFSGVVACFIKLDDEFIEIGSVHVDVRCERGVDFLPRGVVKDREFVGHDFNVKRN